ncbi:Os01g0384901 [Oryza sativa Japonica Group]|uniref:Os01g0384901 protein n=1 Tax=Oryza sativa subsp. japonica TaxID=39947 RepID=A0A0P0V339_ORYSJ|nr:hypothetical protein EE612_002785 [Oryza sativa]BAS72255.1 Os01g0384901 [Oryza sativa Japonica Group]
MKQKFQRLPPLTIVIFLLSELVSTSFCQPAINVKFKCRSIAYQEKFRQFPTAFRSTKLELPNVGSSISYIIRLSVQRYCLTTARL